LGIEKNSKYKSLGIYRPLLNKWKSEILEYCDANKIPYGIDETNELHIYERNRIRKALAILSIDERESEFQRVQKYNNEHKAKLSKIKKAYQLWELHSFSIPFYRSLPKKINEQLIYRYLVKHNIHRISFNKIKLINQFLYSDKTKTELRLGRDVWLLKIDKVLILKKKK
jgi:tRNA(Ile)-lysidine synthase